MDSMIQTKYSSQHSIRSQFAYLHLPENERTFRISMDFWFTPGGGMTWTLGVGRVLRCRWLPVHLSELSLRSWAWRWPRSLSWSSDVGACGGGALWQCLLRPCRSDGELKTPPHHHPAHPREQTEGGVKHGRINNLLASICAAFGSFLSRPESESNEVLWRSAM